MLKKLQPNIEYINSKTKKYYKYNLIGLPKKTVKLPKAERPKSKKYYKEGYKVNTHIYNTLALNQGLGVQLLVQYQ